MAASVATPPPPRLPDFIIGGAPKCGTTSLHFILGQHPDIGIPDDEINYFDADDPILHPDFFFMERGRLRWYEPSAQRDWYAGRFAPFADKRFIGEDSTVYLFSETAPWRVRETLPDAKVVFMLRDPVRRAYSQYWHEMKMGRITCAFERAITRFPTIVRGSTYAPHLKRWIDILGEDRIKVVIFEEFVDDIRAKTSEVLDFLGAGAFPNDNYETWFNETYYPKNVTVQKWVNMIGRYAAGERYRYHMGAPDTREAHIRKKLHYWWFHKINPLFLTTGKPPPMSAATQAYLVKHLSVRNAGLSDLLGRDMTQVWENFRNSCSSSTPDHPSQRS